VKIIEPPSDQDDFPWNEEGCNWIGDNSEARPSMGNGSSCKEDDDAFYHPRLQIGFQLTPKPTYRVAARSRRVE
jgi:hypothetical protein